MPELPEVETVRADLERGLAGAQVSGVRVTGGRSTRRHVDPGDFVDALVGRSFASFERRGKFLVIGLDPGEGRLVVHLRMSGRLLLASPGDAAPAHTHVVVHFADGRRLRFVDPRTFGELFVSTEALPELATLGVDALDPGLTAGALQVLLARRRARLKPMLLDQRVIAGIGNIYSDEILWRAGLRWSRPAGHLRPVEVRRLHDAMVGVLTGAIAERGSSLADGQYVDVAGRPGAFQAHHAVYARAGQACLRCGRRIERTTVAQRSHFWCRRCQR